MTSPNLYGLELDYPQLLWIRASGIVVTRGGVRTAIFRLLDDPNTIFQGWLSPDQRAIDTITIEHDGCLLPSPKPCTWYRFWLILSILDQVQRLTWVQNVSSFEIRDTFQPAVQRLADGLLDGTLVNLPDHEFMRLVSDELGAIYKLIGDIILARALFNY